MNNSVLYGVNVNPLKRNMEESGFSLMRSIYRSTTRPLDPKTNSNILNNGPTLNQTYQDSSSRIHRLKAIAIGKQQYNTVVSYRSYDPNNVSHTLNRLRHAGSAAPKKKGFTA